MRWLTNFHDFKFKRTATAGIGIHPTKAWLSQLVNFKIAISTWGGTICNKILFQTWKNATETYGMLQTAFWRFLEKRPALFKSGQWYFHNAPVHNSILVTDYLTKMNIKTVPQPPYSPDLTPCDFWFFSKLKGCRYERIEDMKEAVTVLDTLLQKDFHGSFQKLLEQYNKCIASGGDYFEGD